MNRRSVLGMLASIAAVFRPTSVKEKPTWWPATQLRVAKDVTSEYTWATSVRSPSNHAPSCPARPARSNPAPTA